MIGLGKIFGRSVKNFGRPGQFLKVWKKIRNVREKISEKMYGKKTRGSKILATRGRGEFVKFYLAPPKCVLPFKCPPKFRDLAPPLSNLQCHVTTNVPKESQAAFLFHECSTFVSKLQRMKNLRLCNEQKERLVLLKK